MRITNFGGILPRRSNRLLPEGGARLAANLSLLSGELRPMRKAKKVYETVSTVDLKSIYRVDAATWFAWPIEFVEMMRAPIEGEARYCYTGDGAPKVTTKTLGTPVNASGTPAAARTLGIPAPITAPTVAAVGGSGAAQNRFYCYTFYSDWNEESAPSVLSAFITGKVDSSWNLSGMDDAPPNSGTITAVSKTASTVTLTFGTGNHYIRAGEVINLAGIGGMTDANGVWTTQSVTNNTITIPLTTAQTYTSGGTWARANPWGTCKKRIYRTTSGSKADFQLVAIDITGTTYSDTLSDQAIPGDSLITNKWFPPPVNMVGLIGLSNGVLAGFYDNMVCFSEPYQPHAWPTQYRKKIPSNIVGISAFDTNVGVATVGNPVVLSGSDPSIMMPTVHAEPLPCVSRASVKGVGDGVIFATKNGLAKMNIGGAALISDDYFGPEEWNDLGTSTLRTAYDGSKIYLNTSKGATYIIKDGQMITSTQLINSMFVDAGTGDFYFSYKYKVYLLDDFASAPMVLDWWSREYVLPRPVNMGAIKVEYDQAYFAKAQAAIAAETSAAIASNVAKIAAGKARGSIGSSAINIRAINASGLDQLPDATIGVAVSFYAKEKLIFSASLTDGQVATMPSGYRSDTFSVRVQGNTQVRAVLVAETPGGLRDA